MSVNSASSSYAGSIASSIIQNQNSSPSTILQAMSQQLLSSMDTNGNGKIDQVEFSTVAKQLSQSSSSSSDTATIFKAIDSNNDGSIDSGELAQALQQSMQQQTQSTQGKHHHHVHSQSGASGMSPQNSTTASTSQMSTAQNSVTSQNQFAKFDSKMMQNILSAYGSNTTLTTSSSTVNTSA